MKIVFATITIVLAVAIGVIAMAALAPVQNGMQTGPLLTYGAAMYLSGVISFGLVLIGVMMIHEKLGQDLTGERPQPKIDITTKEKTNANQQL